MKNLLVVVVLSLLSAIVLAEDIHAATVKTIMLDKNYGLKAYVELNKDMLIRENASCHESGRWEYVIDLSTAFGEKLYSNILVAYSTQSLANFFGTQECIHEGIEELRRLELVM